MLLVKLHHAKPLGIGRIIPEDDSAVLELRRLLHAYADAAAVEDIVAEYKADALAADEVLPDDERLGNAARCGLHPVAQLKPEPAPVAEQVAECADVALGGDDEYLAYPGEHQHRQGIVYHGLIVYREDLL